MTSLHKCKLKVPTIFFFWEIFLWGSSSKQWNTYLFRKEIPAYDRCRSLILQNAKNFTFLTCYFALFRNCWYSCYHSTHCTRKLRISSVNANPQKVANLVTFTREILNGKLPFSAVTRKTCQNFTDMGFSESSRNKKCPYSELLWSLFSPNAGKYGPEYGNFSRSDILT